MVRFLILYWEGWRRCMYLGERGGCFSAHLIYDTRWPWTLCNVVWRGRGEQGRYLGGSLCSEQSWWCVRVMVLEMMKSRVSRDNRIYVGLGRMKCGESGRNSWLLVCIVRWVVLSCAEGEDAGEEQVDGSGWVVKSSAQFGPCGIPHPWERGVGHVEWAGNRDTRDEPTDLEVCSTQVVFELTGLRNST